MILSRVSLRSIRFTFRYLGLRSDDADFGADVISRPDLRGPLHGARGAGFDFLFHFLGGDHVDRCALIDMLAFADEQAGELGLGDGHRHPGNADNEVSHELWLYRECAARLPRFAAATGKPALPALRRPDWARIWRPPARRARSARRTTRIAGSRRSRL